MASIANFQIKHCVFGIGLVFSLLNLGTAGMHAQEVISHWKITSLNQRVSDGQFNVTHLSVSSPSYDVEQILFLRNSTIREELELSPSQIRELNSLLEEYPKFMSEFRKRLYGDGIQNSAEELAKIGEKVREFEGRFSEWLLPHQKSRMKELMFRCVIRRDGFGYAVFSPAAFEAFEITRDQGVPISRAVSEVVEDFSERVQELKTEYWETMEAALPEHARRTYKQHFREFVLQRTPPLDLLAYQLKNKDRLAEIVEEYFEGPANYRGLFTPCNYTVDVAGRLHLGLENYWDGKTNFHRLAQINVFSKLSGDVLDLKADLNLSELQIAELAALKAEGEALFEDYQEQERELARNGATREEEAKLRDIRDAELHKWGERALQKLDTILMPIQKEGLKLLAEGAEFVLGGFSYALEFGNAGKRLGLTAAEKEELRAVSEKFSARIEEETRQWEEEALNRLIGVFNEKQQEMMRKMLGDPLKHTGCDIEIFITSLRNPRMF